MQQSKEVEQQFLFGAEILHLHGAGFSMGGC
jgi:hypothetical protein